MEPKYRIKAGVRYIAHVSTIAHQHMYSVVDVLNIVVSAHATSVVVTGVRKWSVVWLLSEQGIGHTIESEEVSIGLYCQT